MILLPFAGFKESTYSMGAGTLAIQMENVASLLAFMSGEGAEEQDAFVRHEAASWQGFETSLLEYGLTLAAELGNRGRSPGRGSAAFMRLAAMCVGKVAGQKRVDPQWLGVEMLHANHRSLLYMYMNKSQWDLLEPPQPGKLFPVLAGREGWGYVAKDGSVLQMKEPPTDRTPLSERVHCIWCNYWFPLHDLTNGHCPFCWLHKEDVDLIAELKGTGGEENVAVAEELSEALRRLAVQSRLGLL